MKTVLRVRIWTSVIFRNFNPSSQLIQHTTMEKESTFWYREKTAIIDLLNGKHSFIAIYFSTAYWFDQRKATGFCFFNFFVKQIFILSQFWMLEVWKQYVRRACSLWRPYRRIFTCFFLPLAALSIPLLVVVP